MLEQLRLKLHREIVASYDDAVEAMKRLSIPMEVLCIRYCKDGNIDHNMVASNIAMLFGIGMLDNEENPFYISSELDGFIGVNKYVINNQLMNVTEAIQWLGDNCICDPEELTVDGVFEKSEVYQIVNMILGLPKTDTTANVLTKLTRILVAKEDIRRALDTDDISIEHYANKIKELD